MNCRTVSLLAAIAAVSPSTLALADYDIAPAVAAGKIVTNAFTDDDMDYVGNVRVFDFGFDDTTSAPLFTQDPGFHPQPSGGANPASGFTPASSILVGAEGALTYFAGGSSPAFAAAPATTSVSLSYGSNSISILSGGSTGNLLNLGPTDASGEFDNHLDTRLFDSAAAGNLAADGIYLFSLRLSESGLGIASSDPVYILFSVNAEEEDVDAAKLFVRDTLAPGTNLAPAVPEPAAFAAGLPLAALALRRRR